MEKPSNRKIAMILIFLSILILSLVYVYYAFFTTPAYIVDAYCDNNTHFNFTIVNTRSSDLNLTYKWHLDDPKANMPRAIRENGEYTNRYYIGDGYINVPGKSNYNVTISIPPDVSVFSNLTELKKGNSVKETSYYDQTFYVMDVELFDGSKSISHYREQKDSRGWDYSRLPPKRR